MSGLLLWDPGRAVAAPPLERNDSQAEDPDPSGKSTVREPGGSDVATTDETPDTGRQVASNPSQPGPSGSSETTSPGGAATTTSDIGGGAPASQVPAEGTSGSPVSTADVGAAPTASPAPVDDLMAPSKEDEGSVDPPPARGGVLPRTPGVRPGDTQTPAIARRGGLWDPVYRPRSNPAMAHVAVRAGGALASGGSRFNGRGGGVSVDAGVNWNFVGIAAHGTVSAGEWGVGVDSPRVANVMGGGGLTINLGRLALVGAGMMAVSLGYDVLAMPTRRDPRLPPPVMGEAIPANRTHLPHGPRLRLDLGLLAMQSRTGKLRHSLGAHVGYQVLVGDLGLRGGLPPIQVLSIGLTYWMG